MWQHIDAAGRGERRTVRKPASHDPRVLCAAADFIRSFSSELDMLILLGDLATTGKMEDIAHAKEFFADVDNPLAINRKLRPAIGGLGVKMHFLPGNHDRYKDDTGTPGSDLFDRAFGDFYQPVNSVCSETVINGDVTVGIVSADFCYLENEPVSRLKALGCGRANAIVLGELERQTISWKSKNPGKPIVWAVHFSPGEDAPRGIQLENRADVIDLANRLEVRHIFCGHTHVPNVDIGSFPYIYTAGSVSCVECRSQHFLHLARVTKVKSEYELEVRDFRYDEVEDEFVPSRHSKKA